MWGRGQIFQRALGQGRGLAFYFKYNGTLVKGSKLRNDSLIIIVNIIPATEWRLNLRKMREGIKEEMPEGRPLQWSWGVIVWFHFGVAKT